MFNRLAFKCTMCMLIALDEQNLKKEIINVLI